MMKRVRFTGEQIIGVLREQEAGAKGVLHPPRRRITMAGSNSRWMRVRVRSQVVLPTGSTSLLV